VSNEDAENQGVRPYRLPFVGLAVMFVVALIAAVGIVLALNGDSGFTPPAGYFGDVLVLSEAAAEDLGRLAPSTVLAGCLSGDSASCDEQRVNATAAVGRLRDLRAELEALTTPVRASEWQVLYEQALIDLELALGDQVAAIDGRDLVVFEEAVERTRAAVDEEIALTGRFNEEFAGELVADS
jgi:hypothetical protein